MAAVQAGPQARQVEQRVARRRASAGHEFPPAIGPVPAVLRLHRAIGNRATAASLESRRSAQNTGDLTVSAVNDRAELAATHAAAHAMARLGLPRRDPGHPPAPALLRAPHQAADGVVGPEGGTAGPEVSRALRLRRGAGFPLAEPVRERFEPALGKDLSSVRIHTGAEADALGRRLEARAFTCGDDIYFRSGEYRPETAEGQHVLAHELAHTGEQSIHRLWDAAKMARRVKDLRSDDLYVPNSEFAHEAERKIKQMVHEQRNEKLGQNQTRGPGRRTIADGRKDVLDIKVTIAGSGDSIWRTQAEDAGWQKESTAPVYFSRDIGKGPEFMFSGPGKGGDYLEGGGVVDWGTNSIDHLKTRVPPVVRKAIKEARIPVPARPVRVLIRAHSRGAAAASQIANDLEKIEDVKVELTQHDPVPGPQPKVGAGGAAVGANAGAVVGGPVGALVGAVVGAMAANWLASDADQVQDVSGLDESTVIYSIASGYGLGFNPQKAFGAKRIIISAQDHGVGIRKGFEYKGKIYGSSRLNSLREGVYIDKTNDSTKIGELERAESMEDAMEKMYAAYSASVVKYGDKTLLPVITETRWEKIVTVVAKKFDKDPLTSWNTVKTWLNVLAASAGRAWSASRQKN